MNILSTILEYDMHTSRSPNQQGIILETAARPEFLPAVVSTLSPSRFLTVRKLSREGRIRMGVFKTPENLDTHLPALIQAADALSRDESWENQFQDIKAAMAYVSVKSELDDCPMNLLISESAAPFVYDQLGLEPDAVKFNNCKIFTWSGSKSVVMSRPDLVGLLTQFKNSTAALILHNVRLGMAFVEHTNDISGPDGSPLPPEAS